MGGTHEALEHAEHVQHQAHDPFDKRVAMTMAVVAACLASVTLLSHREHNTTILEQAEATTLHSKASDDWNFYQAKNIRTHEYKAFAALVDSLSKDALSEEKATKAKQAWLGKAKTYEEKDLPDLMDKAKNRVEQATQHENLSHESHRRANFFDGGELFIELALVLCSIAILTKMRGFWYSGIAICVFGVAVAVLPFTPVWSWFTGSGGHGAHGDHDPPPASAPETPGKSHKPESGH
jgi:hypothetical protein